MVMRSYYKIFLLFFLNFLYSIGDILLTLYTSSYGKKSFLERKLQKYPDFTRQILKAEQFIYYLSEACLISGVLWALFRFAKVIFEQKLFIISSLLFFLCYFFFVISSFILYFSLFPSSNISSNILADTKVRIHK